MNNPWFDGFCGCSRWKHGTVAVISTVLAGMPALAQKAPRFQSTFIESVQLEPGASRQFPFDVVRRGAGEQVRIGLDVRLHWRKLGGSNGCLRVSVNGRVVTRHHLLNKPHEFAYGRDAELAWSHGNAWRVVFSPSFQVDGAARHALYYDADPFRYVWDVTSLVRSGRNVLTLAVIPQVPDGTHVVVRNGSLEIGETVHAPVGEAVRSAPTGKLDRFIARLPDREAIQVTVLPGGGIQVNCGELNAMILTRTSLPDGRWNTVSANANGMRLSPTDEVNDSWKTEHYRIDRKIRVADDHVMVVDAISNSGTELLGVIVEHRIVGVAPGARVKLAGRDATRGSDRIRSCYHPSAFVAMESGGWGILAENDVFRVHVESFRGNDGVGIRDPQLGIPPGATATLEWSVYPVPGGDYWDFVNAVRRTWQSNISIPGPFVFAMYFRNRQTGPWYADWVQRRGSKILATGVPKYSDGSHAHGTGVLLAEEWIRQQVGWVSKLRRVLPDVHSLVYFHAQISTEPGARRKYADAVLRNANHSQVLYNNNDSLTMYVPTVDNSYGLALENYIDMALDTVKASGIYWDEMSFSTKEFAYHGPWDGCTVIIDPTTHAVKGKRSSTALLMQPFKLKILHRLRERGKMIIANTPAATQTMHKQSVVRFVETPSYSRVIDAHLSCPIGLGNHQREESQADAARSMRKILDQGGVYYTHLYQREPARWNFTDEMYPITPVELRAGVVLGKERILTSRSGVFGWPAGEKAEVFVVDGEGRRIAKVEGMVRLLKEADQWRYEIRMPSDHFAILVKKSDE